MFWSYTLVSIGSCSALFQVGLYSGTRLTRPLHMRMVEIAFPDTARAPQTTVSRSVMAGDRPNTLFGSWGVRLLRRHIHAARIADLTAMILEVRLSGTGRRTRCNCVSQSVADPGVTPLSLRRLSETAFPPCSQPLHDCRRERKFQHGDATESACARWDICPTMGA